MALSKKGIRKITIDGKTYQYKISKIKKVSEWKEEDGQLNETFMEYAKYYGLGSVADAVINIIIQSTGFQISRIIVKIHTLLIDGFMGPEQITQVTPRLISHLIKIALEDNWNPQEKPDYRMELAEQNTKDKQPVILQLPKFNEDVKDYQSLNPPVEINLARN